MMASEVLYQALDAVARPLRGASGLARLLSGMAAVAGLFTIAAWLARAGWVTGPGGVLVAWMSIVVILAGSFVVARRAIRELGPWRVGHDLEAAGAWRHGALTTLLDPRAAMTSESLHAFAAAQRADEVLSRAPAVLGAALGRQRHQVGTAAAALGLALVGLLAARPATGAPAGLWHPAAAWRALTAPVRLSARRMSVARGEPAVLNVTAIGRRRAALYTRAPGEAWRATDVALDADGTATVTTAPLTADLVARVQAGGRQSPEIRVVVRLAAFLGAFTATAHYPPYLGMQDEALPTAGDTMVLPEGTRLSIAGRSTTPVAAARLMGPDGDETLDVHKSSFAGDLRPRRSGVWRLAVRTADGATLQGEMPSLPVRLVVDSAPVVEIPVPGADTVATASMSLGLVISVRDDHGITAAQLDTRRGNSVVVQRTPLALTPGGGDRALIATRIDLAALGLKPGDTLRYLASAVDNAPARHVGRSREFVVRIPTEAEQRVARARESAAALTGFDSLSRQAGRVQRTEEDLARERQRVDVTPGADGTKAPLASDAARTAEAAARAQQQVLDDATKLQRAVQD
ncbi:MAG: hypothetical protein ACRELE_04795, partial [Gemmatimonadales bacterium]